jgi:D-arabinose 1-dehydrogenase-like Zn-dependent alcohol dehydrogenase
VTDLPATARAAVLTEFSAPLEIRELPVPTPEPRALVVRVRAASICGTDVHFWHGHGNASWRLPVVLGHEIVGEVAAIGAGAEVDSLGRPLLLGDRVIWTHGPCGRCYNCTILHHEEWCSNIRMGMSQPIEEPPHLAGGFAEYSYVWPSSGRVRVPDAVEDGWAAAASCALRTVISAFNRLGEIDGRHSVVIQGAGPLGLFATAIASLRGPRRLIVIGAPADRLQLALDWGADEVVDLTLDSSPEARRDRVFEAVGSRGADVTLELSGGRNAFAEGLELLGDGGRYMVVGTISGGTQAVNAPLIVMKALTILSNKSAFTDSFAAALDFMERHRDRFDWGRMLSSEYPLEQTTEALERMERFDEIKAVIRPLGVGAGGRALAV